MVTGNHGGGVFRVYTCSYFEWFMSSANDSLQIEMCIE